MKLKRFDSYRFNFQTDETIKLVANLLASAAGLVAKAVMNDDVHPKPTGQYVFESPSRRKK